MTTNTTYQAIDFAHRWHDFWRGEIGEWVITRGLRIVMLLIGAVLIPGAKAPYLVLRDFYLGEADFFAARGYNVLVPLLRGIGGSGGAWDHGNFRQAGRDAHDLIVYAEAGADAVKVVKVDVDANPQVAQQYGVRSIPTIGLFEAGELTQHVAGVLTERRRGIDRDRGCMVIVRPDQYVAHVLPLDGYGQLASFFDGFMTRPN